MREAIERNQEMARVYQTEDLTLVQLGARYGITKQRLKQIFAGMGVVYEQSGRCARLRAAHDPSKRMHRPFIPAGMTEVQYWRPRALEALGGRCVVCGLADERCLEIDHINGDGAHERRRTGLGGASTYYRKIAKGRTDGVQVLCANHHAIKTREERRKQ